MSNDLNLFKMAMDAWKTPEKSVAPRQGPPQASPVAKPARLGMVLDSDQAAVEQARKKSVEVQEQDGLDQLRGQLAVVEYSMWPSWREGLVLAGLGSAAYLLCRMIGPGRATRTARRAITGGW